MSMISNFRSAMKKHAAYVRTRNEIRDMPRDMARDLGIFPEDAERIAWDAIYG